LDPLADKILLTASFVVLTWLKVLPFWITAVVLSRDVFLALGTLLIHMVGARIYPRPTWAGKAATFLQILTVLAGVFRNYTGLRPGDRVLAVNGHALRDAIDFQFHAADAVLRVDIEREGLRRPLTLVRARPDLGVELEAPRAGDIATCANKCVFCFIHQLPKGVRKSLYVKDDDFRLSFLHGNYITLSDLDGASFERIIEQRLSPLYISVHATDPELRHALLG